MADSDHNENGNENGGEWEDLPEDEITLHLLNEFCDTHGAATLESWILRRDPEKDHCSKTKKTNNASRGCSDAVTVVTVENLPQVCCLEIASFLDPIDWMSWEQTCKHVHAAVGLQTTTAAAPASSTGTATAASKSIPENHVLRLRLQSLLDYFSILQVYTDQIDKLGYDWTQICRFLTRLAWKLQHHVYGFQYVVHPLHRALLAEQVLDELCNYDPQKDTPSGLPPWWCGYNGRNVNAHDDYYRTAGDDFATTKHLFHPNAVKRHIHSASAFAQLVRRSGGDYTVLLGDSTDLIEGEGDEDTCSSWHYQQAQQYFANMNNDDNSNTQGLLDYSTKRLLDNMPVPARQALMEGRLPQVWILADTTSEPVYYGIAHSIYSNEEDESKRTDLMHVAETSSSRRCWDIDINESFKAFWVFFCVAVDEEDIGEGVEEQYQLLRLAWVYAHRVPPFDKPETLQTFDWQEALNLCPDADERLRQNVRACFQDRLPLANAKKYFNY